MQLSTYGQTMKPAETTEVTPPANEVIADVVPDTPPVSNEQVPPASTDIPPANAPAIHNPSERVFAIDIPEETPTVQPPNTPATQSYDWKKEIKSVDRKELLKEAGVTDFAIEIDEYLSKGGNAADYLAARAIDYNQVTDESLIKEDLKKQYPTFSPAQIDIMFSRKYQPVSELDDDKEFAELQLKADAHNIRQTKIQQQASFKIPDAPILQKDEAYEQWKQQQQQQPQLMEQFRNYYETHPATKSLHESKRVTINLGEGVQPFNFLLEKPQVLTRALTDGGAIINSALTTQSGEPDVAKQNLVTLFTLDPQKFMQDIFNYGRSMGVQKELVEEGQNAQRPQAIVAQLETSPPTYKVGKYGG